MNKIIHDWTMVILMIVTFSILFYPEQTEESFTYFPPDPTASFQFTHTSLTLLPKHNDRYRLDWKTNSTLDRKAYLRQDISLLYANGLLTGKMGEEWKQNVTTMTLKEKIPYQDSANFKSISFHHGELHENGHITSVQSITNDELYVVDSSFSPLQSFREPRTTNEQEWKDVLDKLTEERITSSIDKAAKTYSIKKNLYTIYWLTQFHKFSSTALPGFSSEESSQIIGRLWEGIYKNYFLGVRMKDGTYADPSGSTIPVILLAKDKSHLIVISELSNGEMMLLRQMIQYQ